MSLLPNLSKVLHPRAIVTINDIVVNWTDIRLTTETYYTADNYEIDLPLNDQPSPIDQNYFMGAQIFTVKIYIGFPDLFDFFVPEQLELMMVGDVDDIDVDLLSGKVAISGRDLTSRFIDSKTTQKFPSLTSSQIATKLALAHGLNPVVTPTTTIVGIYYQYYQTLLSRQASEWDLLTYLAQIENFIVFVRGEDLVFEPIPSETSAPYVLQYQPPGIDGISPTFNGMDLQFQRSMTLANDVTVKLRVPFNPKTGKSFTVTVTSKHTRQTNIPGLPNSRGKKQIYSIRIPGLTKDQALKRAQVFLKNITIHEIKLSARMPADNVLKKDSVIQVIGTNTAADQIYFCDRVERTIRINEGYMMTIQGKNHSVDSQIIV